MPPKRRATSATTSATAFASATSQGNGWARAREASWAARTVSFSASARRETIATFQPSRRRRSATARPTPLPAPVTIATFGIRCSVALEKRSHGQKSSRAGGPHSRDFGHLDPTPLRVRLHRGIHHRLRPGAVGEQRAARALVADRVVKLIVLVV